MAQSIAILLALVFGENSGLVFSAFLGAFFPFLFLVGWHYAQKFTERLIKSHDAMVRIDYKISQMILPIASENARGLDKDISLTNENSDDNRIFIAKLGFRSIPTIENDDLHGLLDLDLKNKVSLLNMDVESTNFQASLLRDQYQKAIEAKVGTQLDPTEHELLMDSLKQSLTAMKDIQYAYLGILESCKRTIAHERCIRNSFLKNRLIQRIFHMLQSNITDKDLEAEEQKLKEQIIKSRKLPTTFEIGEKVDIAFWLKEGMDNPQP